MRASFIRSEEVLVHEGAIVELVIPHPSRVWWATWAGEGRERARRQRRGALARATQEGSERTTCCAIYSRCHEQQDRDAAAEWKSGDGKWRRRRGVRASPRVVIRAAVRSLRATGCCAQDHGHGCRGACVEAGVGDREAALEAGWEGAYHPWAARAHRGRGIHFAGD